MGEEDSKTKKKGNNLDEGGKGKKRGNKIRVIASPCLQCQRQCQCQCGGNLKLNYLNHSIADLCLDLV